MYKTEQSVSPSLRTKSNLHHCISSAVLRNDLYLMLTSWSIFNLARIHVLRTPPVNTHLTLVGHADQSQSIGIYDMAYQTKRNGALNAPHGAKTADHAQPDPALPKFHFKINKIAVVQQQEQMCKKNERARLREP